jgi:hypothetical protein
VHPASPQPAGADLHVDELNITDLRSVEAKRFRIVGSVYVCSARGRKDY